MTGVGVIAVATVRECTRRRVFVVIVVLTALFLALYTLGTVTAFRHLGKPAPGDNVDLTVLAGATLLGLAMFATLFLSTVVAVFLTFNVLRGDAEQGLLQPMVVRPPGRIAFLGARFGAAAAVSAAYAAAVYAAAVVITGLAGGWWPDEAVLPAIELAAAAVIVTAISLAGSVYLSTIANGIAVLMLFGAGLVGGLLGQIGDAIHSDTLSSIGTITSWALPFDALYQAALHALTGETSGITGVIVHLGPLGGAQPAGPLLAPWVLGYVAVVVGLAAAAFVRRDL
jgi:ABC-type transport system involved in multi-copper enzyme maturation permease subunit